MRYPVSVSTTTADLLFVLGFHETLKLLEIRRVRLRLEGSSLVRLCTYLCVEFVSLWVSEREQSKNMKSTKKRSSLSDLLVCVILKNMDFLSESITLFYSYY